MIAWVLISLAARAEEPADLRPQYEEACRAGQAIACRNLAGVLAQGTDLARDEVAARAWARAGCDLGDALSCGILGFLEVAGRGGPADPATAVGHLGPACDAGDAVACRNLALLRGDPGQGRFDPAQARSAWQKACDLGEADACDVLGRLFTAGQGGPADPEAAARVFDVACVRGSAGGCAHRGQVLVEGIGVAADPGAGLDLIRRACSSGSADGCLALGGFILSGKVLGDPAEARVALERGCVLGDREACAFHAQALAEGLGGPVDAPTALVEARQACEAGSPRGCDTTGVLLTGSQPGVDADLVAARASFQRACDGAFASGCAHLAQILALLADPAEAPSLDAARKKACDLGDAASCQK